MIYPWCIEDPNIDSSLVYTELYFRNFFDCYPDFDEQFNINYNSDSHSIDGWGRQMIDAWNDGDDVEAGQLYGTMVRELLAPCEGEMSNEFTIEELKALKEKDMKAKELLFS